MDFNHPFSIKNLLASSSESKDFIGNPNSSKYSSIIEENERTGDEGNWPQNGVASGYFKVIRCDIRHVHDAT